MLGGVLQQLIITPSNDNHKAPRQTKKTTMQTTIVSQKESSLFENQRYFQQAADYLNTFFIFYSLLWKPCEGISLVLIQIPEQYAETSATFYQLLYKFLESYLGKFKGQKVGCG